MSCFCAPGPFHCSLLSKFRLVTCPVCVRFPKSYTLKNSFAISVQTLKSRPETQAAPTTSHTYCKVRTRHPLSPCCWTARSGGVQEEIKLNSSAPNFHFHSVSNFLWTWSAGSTPFRLGQSGGGGCSRNAILVYAWRVRYRDESFGEVGDTAKPQSFPG